MALPEPKRGLIFRYDYLWLREADSGKDTSKERPACLVLTTDSAIKPRLVVILPITHSKPQGRTKGIPIPAEVRRKLGLDDQPSWIITNEYNIDEWPNPGIAPLPGARSRFSYGILPLDVLEAVLVDFLKHYDPTLAVRR